MRSQRREVRYTRVLVVGLAVSLLVHGALLGLGRLSFGSGGSEEGPLSVVTLPPETDVTKPELDTADESSPMPAEMFAMLELSSAAVGPELAEYPYVIDRARNAPAMAPLVPRPRFEPLTVETGLTPIRTPIPTGAVAMGGGGDRGNGLDGLHVIVMRPAGIGHGGDSCRPGGRFINYHRSPIVRPTSPLRRW
jgi:hypothetical protein